MSPELHRTPTTRLLRWLIVCCWHLECGQSTSMSSALTLSWMPPSGSGPRPIGTRWCARTTGRSAMSWTRCVRIVMPWQMGQVVFGLQGSRWVMNDQSSQQPVLSRLFATAVAATPGPWERREGAAMSIVASTANVCGIHDGGKTLSGCEGDAEFIATFDPPTVLRLLAVVEAAKKRIGGSHAMGCSAYSTLDEDCDCGRHALMAALEALGA